MFGWSLRAFIFFFSPFTVFFFLPLISAESSVIGVLRSGLSVEQTMSMLIVGSRGRS